MTGVTDNKNTLILMCDNREPARDLGDYVALAAYGNYKYAQVHGYAFAYIKPYSDVSADQAYCCRNPMTGAARFAAWAKVIAAHHMLKYYERVVYIDSDAFFNNHKSLDELLKCQGNKTLFCSDHPFNPDKPNSGFFVCYRTEETFEFLRSWYCDPHNEARYDATSSWEQASLFSWNLVNTQLAKYYTVLPVNQFKLRNFKTGYSWQQFNSTAESDIVGNRSIINHYFMKKPEEMQDDLLKMYSMEDFNNVLDSIKESIRPLDTERYIFTPPQDVTVIISGSYLDSHPEITFMREVIESLDLAGIPLSAPVILSHDRIKPDTEGAEEKEVAYQQYFKNLESYIRLSKRSNITISQAPEWGHLTRTLKYAVSQVKTKYMLVLQHDIHIRREIPVLEMLDLMEKNSHIKHLRFNVRKNLPTFMWWDGYAGGNVFFGQEEYDGVKLCITPAWSDQNHLATKEYYENVVFPDCTNPDGELIYDFMENRLNGLCHHNHTRYGTYVYGGWGESRTSRHSDGRKSSPEADED